MPAGVLAFWGVGMKSGQARMPGKVFKEVMTSVPIAAGRNEAGVGLLGLVVLTGSPSTCPTSPTPTIADWNPEDKFAGAREERV